QGARSSRKPGAQSSRNKGAASSESALKPIILEGDWTFVTKNSVDFRGKDKRAPRDNMPKGCSSR
ncbi:hypothetical protein GOA68_30465, partial [Sinorhizobium meliloti]|nr:hypothetical protein [Sinorhizobium meliloti]MDW9992588.1 hypothetical protein [Sinorhizobium meliloti]MDX0246874.1 hypothetical protein [Sinorhizobium meliloti]MDX0403020.1 hypothetical protein [Sinorhizobium meliloti]